ncbi:MAG: sulfatase-like hydrolase/transferase [Myxococcota bacterium]
MKETAPEGKGSPRARITAILLVVMLCLLGTLGFYAHHVTQEYHNLRATLSLQGRGLSKAPKTLTSGAAQGITQASDARQRRQMLDELFPKTEQTPICARCNVVLVSVDTLRADRMSAYGYAEKTTPQMEAFFGEQGRFEWALSSAPCTMPSVPQLLTSSFNFALPTLAEILSHQGYRTSALVSQSHFTIDSRISHGFHRYETQWPDEVDHHGMSTRRATAITDRAVDWIARHADNGGGRPFLLWLHYFDPHDPYQPPEAWRRPLAALGRHPDGDRRRAQQARLEAMTPQEQAQVGGKWYRVDDPFSEADRRQLSALYDAEIRYTDRELGRVFAALDASGQAERTIVILTSDHGEWLGEQGRWDHCQTLEMTELHVPLLWKVPGFTFAGRQRMASTLDIVPTVLHLLGDTSQVRSRFAGQSLVVPPSSDQEPRAVVSSWNDQLAATSRRWRLVFNYTNLKWLPARLERATDPTRPGGQPAEGSFREVPMEQHADVMEQLEQVVGETPTLGIDTFGINRETLEQLRELGYIH